MLANGSQLITEPSVRLKIFPRWVLPVQDDSKEKNNPVSVSEPSTHSEGPKEASHNPDWPHVQQVLIVDDNDINRRLLSVFMKKSKTPFKEAKNGLEALDLYREAEKKFDTILMDVSMPVMDGMTSTRHIREHEAQLNLEAAHIIALTGLTSASAKLEAWTSGVDDFLTKPVDFAMLRKLMKAGRGGEGTGFMEEDDLKSIKEEEPGKKAQELSKDS
jgi:CheY-like chemotaxis protein